MIPELNLRTVVMMALLPVSAVTALTLILTTDRTPHPVSFHTDLRADGCVMLCEDPPLPKSSNCVMFCDEPRPEGESSNCTMFCDEARREGDR